jgi:hypothetical protein
VALYNRKLSTVGGRLSQSSGEGATANAWEFDSVTNSWEIPFRTQ